jgi:L-asparaginase
MKDGDDGQDVASSEEISTRLDEIAKGFPFAAAFEYKPFHKRIDSSAATPADWKGLADMLVSEDSREDSRYLAFVVIHGTDTLAYTSAALSFLMPHGFAKAVIVTGSQVPVLVAHSDAPNNFLGSLRFALEVPGGVYVYFANKLMRGACVMKTDSQRWDAFASPRTPLVGEIKDGQAIVNCDMKQKLAAQLPPTKVSNCRDVPSAQHYPSLLQLHPGMQLDSISCTSKRAILIIAHGTGNGPPALAPLIRTFLDKGGLVAVTTECLHGRTNRTYAHSVSGWDSRIVPCGAMSVPAAYAKMTVCLGTLLGVREQKELGIPEQHGVFKNWMEQNVAGEIQTDEEPNPDASLLATSSTLRSAALNDWSSTGVDLLQDGGE